MNTVRGTYLSTFSAGNTLVVVYNCQIVNNRNSLRGTGTSAFTTADTAVDTVFSRERTLVPVRAGNSNSGAFVVKGDNVVWTGAYADSTANALFGVYLGNPVRKKNRILGTDGSTVPIAKTGKGASLVTRIRHVGGATAQMPLVAVFSLNSITVTVAANIGNTGNNGPRLNT